MIVNFTQDSSIEKCVSEHLYKHGVYAITSDAVDPSER